MRFSLTSRGSYDRTASFLERMNKLDVRTILHDCGRMGVEALAAATPVRTSLAAYSWDYEVTTSRTGVAVQWVNTDIENGFRVVIALQYGYATGTGGYVQGRDYINPAMSPVFDNIEARVRKVVESA